MSTQWQTFPIEYRGGLISNMSALQQGANAVGSATILQNFEPNKEGGYSKILGYEKFSTSALSGSGNVLGIKVADSGNVIAARQNASNVTEYYYSTGGAWTSISAATALGNNIKHTEVNFNGTRKFIFVDSVNYPVIIQYPIDSVTPSNSFTEFTSAISSDLEGATHVVRFKTTVFFAKNSNLYYSAVSNESDFSATSGAGSINVGEEITGLTVFREQLIIFTKNTVQRITGSSFANWELQPITESIGCVDGNTIQEVGGDIMYLADDGIRLLSATDRIGDFALGLPSDIIAKDASEFISATNQFSSITIRKKAQYRIFSFIESQQAGGAQGLLVTKFIAQGSSGLAWGKTKGIKVNVIDSDYTSTVETICFGNTDGYVYKLDTGSSFDGGNIEAIYESPFMPVTDPQIRKTFYKHTLYLEPLGTTNFTVGLKFDFDRIPANGVLQPATQTITSTGSAVSFYGNPSYVYARTESFTATASQTAFVIQDVAYTVGTNIDKVALTINGVASEAFSVASVADGDNYDITITLDTGATEDDVIFVALIPPSVTKLSYFGGELDKIYNTNVIGSGKTVALRITDNSTNPSFTLDTSILEFRQNDRQ